MFGEMLREARRKNRMTQSDLAQRLGTTQPVVSRWERGRARPSPSQREALQELFGLTESAPPESRTPTLRPLPDREPDRLSLPIEVRVWQRPEIRGDIAIVAGLPKDDVLLAVLDTVGRGAAVALAAQHMRGWLRGWIASRRVAVRLDELVSDLGTELRTARLDATWFLAVLGRVEGPHAATIHMASHAFPSPLLLCGPRQETRATRTESDPGQPHAEVSFVRHENLEAPWKLVVATDGLLSRLGAGS